MKPRSLLVLALVVAALGTFIWFIERDLPSTDERADRAKKILPLEVDEIDAVRIRHEGTEVRLERVAPATASEPAAGAAAAAEENDEPEWRLVEPLAARADADAVGDLLAGLTGLDKERTLEEADAAALGLAEPRATVTITAAGQERVLRVGEKVPASSNVIIDLDGGPDAFVVADTFWSDLTRAPGDWRSRRAFPAERGDVTGVRLRGAEEVVLLRDGNDFRLVEPFADEADADRVDDLLTALTDLEVSMFVDGPKDREALGLEPAAATLAVSLEGREAPLEIALGSPAVDEEAARYVEVEGQGFTAETELADLAALAPSAWRSTEWSRLEVYEIDAVEVRRGETTLRLARADGKWTREDVEIPYTLASDLLYAVSDAETERLLDPGAVDPGEPLYEISLTAETGGETLRVFEATGDGYPAEREGRVALFLLTTESVDELVAKIEEARRAEPVPAAGDEPPGD